MAEHARTPFRRLVDRLRARDADAPRLPETSAPADGLLVEPDPAAVGIPERDRAVVIERSLVLRGEKYYLEGEHEAIDGPFCRRCQDSSTRLVRLKLIDAPVGSPPRAIIFRCPICGSNHPY